MLKQLYQLAVATPKLKDFREQPLIVFHKSANWLGNFGRFGLLTQKDRLAPTCIT